MKLIWCEKCYDLVMLIREHTRTCKCGYISGKYLNDNIIAVVSKDAIVVGIDNNGFNIAKIYSEDAKKFDNRVDYFFTGWIPNHPGEIITVDTVKEVEDYPFEMKEEDKNYTSTSPTEF